VPVAWRILKSKYAAYPFDGEGARLYGGRWTSPGRPAVYAADSAALAALEVLVHLQSAAALSHYVLVSVEFPASQVVALGVEDLPPTWRSAPAPPALRALGDAWLADGRSAVLQVPSAVVSPGSNYLLNPRHPEFETFKLGRVAPFEFDPRLASRNRGHR
jgi:RES domain-containing protein